MKFYGELLVFALLFITNLRVFFVQQVRRDPLVVLAPFTFIVAILQILAWGIDLFTVLGLLIALFVLLSNFHALFRYMERLYIDHYSGLMKVWAVFTIMISAIALAGTIYFAPIEQNSRSMGVAEKITHYKGSFRTGFEEAGPFDAKSMTLYEYSPDASKASEEAAALVQAQKLIILLTPDKRGDTENYKPYLQELASRGLTICSADFFADDGQWLHSFADKKILRRLVMVIQSRLNLKAFEAQREYFSYNVSQEYDALIPMLRKRYGTDKKILLISDFMADIAADDFMKKNPDLVAGVLKLSSINTYKSAGYGCIEQTDPLLALSMGLSRDASRTTPKLLADETEEMLKQVQHDSDLVQHDSDLVQQDSGLNQQGNDLVQDDSGLNQQDNREGGRDNDLK